MIKIIFQNKCDLFLLSMSYVCIFDLIVLNTIIKYITCRYNTIIFSCIQFADFKLTMLLLRYPNIFILFILFSFQTIYS